MPARTRRWTTTRVICRSKSYLCLRLANLFTTEGHWGSRRKSKSPPYEKRVGWGSLILSDHTRCRELQIPDGAPRASGFHGLARSTGFGLLFISLPDNI